MISKLAYKDGLTDIGNRTAYMEAMDKLIAESSETPIGIVMFDINNLKYINDNMRHSEGDKLIKICSQIIKDTFGREGEVYRIGGDEFVSIIEGNSPKELYSKMKIDFESCIERENMTGNHSFEISIAHGVSYCSIKSKYYLQCAQDLADREMYKNKKELKKRKH